jgi:hypothetical protein
MRRRNELGVQGRKGRAPGGEGEVEDDDRGNEGQEAAQPAKGRATSMAVATGSVVSTKGTRRPSRVWTRSDQTPQSRTSTSTNES